MQFQMQGPEQQWPKKIEISIGSMVLYRLVWTYKIFTYTPSETSDKFFIMGPASKAFLSTIQ